MAARLLDESARGVYIIAATPFVDTGELDLDSTDRLIDFYLEHGVDGITILGVMGEAPKLSAAEAMTFAERVLKRVASRVPIIVGASSPGNRNLATLARKMMDIGAAGVMVAPVAGLRTEEQVAAYIGGVVEELGPDVPIVLQDYPQLTNVYMSAALINTMLAQWPSLKVVKHEESPGLRKISKLRAAEAAGERRRVSILVGNSAIHLPQELRRGADGANTGVAFPEMLVEVCRRFFAGDADGAEDLYDAYLPVIRHEQQAGVGLVIRKEIFRRRGIIKSAYVRAPGASLDADDHKELDGLMRRLDRRLKDMEHGPARLRSVG